jgi:uncharacterized phage-associated protein
MAINSLTAAKKVCEASNWTATNLTVNKILYLAQMMRLGRTSGVQPLVAEHFQAWDYGPVLPTVYHRLKAFGNGPAGDVFLAFPDIDGIAEADLINEAVNSLRDKTPGQLIAITHWDDGAWAKNYRPGARNLIIPNADIYEEYRKRVG